MKCARENCDCLNNESSKYDLNGKVYCCEKCAIECTDENCVCTPEDCAA